MRDSEGRMKHAAAISTGCMHESAPCKAAASRQFATLSHTRNSKSLLTDP